MLPYVTFDSKNTLYSFRLYLECDFCEGCEDWEGSSHLPTHTLIKVPFALHSDDLKKQIARAMEFMRKTELAPPEFTPGTCSITGDFDQSHSIPDDEPDTKSEGEEVQGTEAPDTPVTKPEPVAEPLSCHGGCDDMDPIRGPYFRCVECPGKPNLRVLDYYATEQ